MPLFFKKDPMKVVEEHLSARGMKYLRTGAETIMSGTLTPVGMVMTIIRHELSKESLLFLFLPTKAPMQALEAISGGNLPLLQVHARAGHSGEQIARVCEHLMHKNYETFLGSFERDNSDGEIRFRVALPYRNTTPTPEQVGWCLDIGFATLTHGIIEINEILGKAKTMEI